MIRTFFLVMLIGSYCALGLIDLAQGNLKLSAISFLLVVINGLVLSNGS